MKPGYLATAILLVGAGLVFASLALGWYEFRFVGQQAGSGGAANSTFSGTYAFFPGPQYRTYATCSGDTQFCMTFNPTSFSGPHSYANPGPGFIVYPSTGQMYAALEWIEIVAGGLAVSGGILTARGTASGLRKRRLPALLAGIAFALAVTGPVLVWVATPTLVGEDYHTAPNSLPANFTGPSGSFWGTCSSPTCGSGGGVTDSWGPTSGWYLAWSGGALLLGGVAAAVRSSRSLHPPPAPEGPGVTLESP